MLRTFSIIRDTEAACWAACPHNVVTACVHPMADGKFELRYSL